MTPDLSSVHPVGAAILAVLVPLWLFCPVYLVKRALDEGAPARWVLAWTIAVPTFIGIFVIGFYSRVIRRHGYHHPHNAAAVTAAVAVMFAPLSPLIALGVIGVGRAGRRARM